MLVCKQEICVPVVTAVITEKGNFLMSCAISHVKETTPRCVGVTNPTECISSVCIRP